MATADIGELDRARYISLATYRLNGAEVATPVWFAAADGRFYVFTAEQSGKAKRLRHSQRARVAPSDARGRVRGEWREATARILTEPRTIERAYAALQAKYGWQMRVTNLLSSLTGRINHRAWVEIQL
jgi:PPOX class probable F420-dependent enzyme